MGTATRDEDFNEKTDAWLAVKGYDPFRIQIKSRAVTKKEQNKFFREGIILIGIPPEDKLETIQDNTLKQIRKYLRINNREPNF